MENANTVTKEKLGGQENVIKRFLDIYDVGSVVQGLNEMFRSYIADQEFKELNSEEQLQRSYSNNSFLIQEITLLILALDKEYHECNNNPIHLVGDVN